MATLGESITSLENLITEYNKLNRYISFNSTPETSKQNAMLTHLCVVPFTQTDILSYFTPLPGEYEDTEHTDDSAIHAASAYLATIKRIEQMSGFNGTETPGLYYRIIKAHAFCDAAFFLKPQLNLESPSIIIEPDVNTLVIPPICPDISSPEFKTTIKENGSTFTIEFFGYILVETNGVCSVHCTNGSNIVYSARIWLGDEALVNYASDDVSAWAGWSNITNSSLSVYRVCNSGDRIPIRILYTQQEQPIDAYDFGISIEMRTFGNGTTPNIIPKFLVRTDANGDPYEPANLIISKMKTSFNSSNNRFKLRHIPIKSTNNWRNNTIARALTVKMYSNTIQYNIFNSTNTSSSTNKPPVKLYPNGIFVVNNKVYRPKTKAPVCATDNTCGSVLQLTDSGDIVIQYTTTGIEGGITSTGTAIAFKRNTINDANLKFAMHENWMLAKGEWPILGSPQHLSKGNYLSQSNTKTQFYSSSSDNSPALFETQIYSRNGRYMLAFKNSNLVVVTNSVVNPTNSISIFSMINQNNSNGGTYYFKMSRTSFIPEQQFISPTNAIFGQNNTYEKYNSTATNTAKLGFPPKVMEGSTSYKQSNVSADQCKQDCDALKTGCSHYYTITQQNQPGCIINIDGNNPEYLPKQPSSQITDSNLYIKNRTIMSNCKYTTKDLKTPLNYNSSFWPMKITPFITPENEGACGNPGISQLSHQLQDINSNLEPFAGYNASTCTLGTNASIADCKLRAANNVKAIGQYTISHNLSQLNQNAINIRNLTNEIIGDNTPNDGRVTRYPITNDNNSILADSRSKYLNPRDIISTTTDVRLSDTEKDVSQQSTQLIMGIAASVAVGLFALSIATR